MAKERLYAISKFAVALILFTVLIWAALQFDPHYVIETLGARYIYLALFLISLFSGVFTVTSGPFYAALSLAIVGGLDPVLVALAVAPGVFIGDMVFLYLIVDGLDLVGTKLNIVNRIHSWFADKPRWAINWATFVFFGVIPLSADVYLSVLAVGGIRPREIWPYILAGNITFFVLLGYLVTIGSPWIEKVIS